MMKKFAIHVLVCGLGMLGGGLAHAQGEPDYELPPVRYSASTPRDAVADLQQRISSG
jgi:hypothetical protein